MSGRSRLKIKTNWLARAQGKDGSAQTYSQDKSPELTTKTGRLSQFRPAWPTAQDKPTTKRGKTRPTTEMGHVNQKIDTSQASRDTLG